MPSIPALGEGVVYFLLLSDGRTKIGVTSNWVQRRKTHLSNGLCIVDEMVLGVTHGRLVEKHYHEKFKDKRIEREFFELKKSDYLYVVDNCLDLATSFDREPVIKYAVFPSMIKVGWCQDCQFVCAYETLGMQDGKCIFCRNDLRQIHHMYLSTKSHPG